MPIPFFIAGAVGVFSVAARGVNKDLKTEINLIYDKIESLADDTNKKVEAEMEYFNNVLDKNDKKKIGIVEYIVEPFVEELNKIKSSQLRERIDSGTVQKILEVRVDEYGIKRYNDTTSQKIVGTMKDLFTVSLGTMGVVVSYVEYEKLVAQKKIAEGKLEQAKLQSEEVNNKIAAMREMSQQINEITDVLEFMEKILRNAFFSFMSLVKRSGYDYSNYTREEKQSLMLIVDVFNGVNSIIIKPIIKEDGSFNSELIDHSLSLVDLIEKNEDIIKAL